MGCRRLQFSMVCRAVTAHEFGHAEVHIQKGGRLGLRLTDVEGQSILNVWMSHGDKVTEFQKDLKFSQPRAAPGRGGRARG